MRVRSFVQGGWWVGGVVASCVAASLMGGCSALSPKAMVDQPPRQSFDRRAAAQARVELGMRHLVRGNLPEARKNIEQALCHHPESYRAQLAMALYWQRTGERRSAHACYQRALRLAPQAGELLNHYGTFLCTQRRYDEAQHYFSAALQAPGYAHMADGLQNSGSCYLQAGELSMAQRQLQRALKHQPDQGVHWLVLATQAFERGERQYATGLLDIYEQLCSVSAESLWLRLRLSAQAGAASEVRRCGAQLARDFPHSPHYQRYLAHDN